MIILDEHTKEYENETFSGLNRASTTIRARVFHSCVFDRCDFSQADISGSRFIECRFLSCNLSNARVVKTALRSVQFSGSKLLGINFTSCDRLLLGMSFEDTDLSYAVFAKLPLKKTAFRRCNMQSCQFEECDLSDSIYDDTNLRGTHFNQCNLSRADFRTARNYCFDPSKNKLADAKFAVPECLNLLVPFGVIVEGTLRVKE